MFCIIESVSSNLIDFNTEILQPSDTQGGAGSTSFFGADSASQQNPLIG